LERPESAVSRDAETLKISIGLSVRPASLSMRVARMANGFTAERPGFCFFARPGPFDEICLHADGITRFLRPGRGRFTE
jgi:hypothetical protein